MEGRVRVTRGVPVRVGRADWRGGRCVYGCHLRSITRCVRRGTAGARWGAAHPHLHPWGLGVASSPWHACALEPQCLLRPQGWALCCLSAELLLEFQSRGQGSRTPSGDLPVWNVETPHSPLV